MSKLDKKMIMEKRHELMKKLQDSLQQELIAAMLSKSDDHPDLEILNVVFDEIGSGDQKAIGEFMFLPPVTDEDAVQYFTGVITVADELEKYDLTGLFEALAYINFRLPCGAFSIDKDRRYLAYKLTVPMPMDLNEDDVFKSMNIALTNSEAFCGAYMDMIYKFMDGESKLEDICALLG